MKEEKVLVNSFRLKDIKKEFVVPSYLEPAFANSMNIAFKDDEFTITFMHEAPNDPKIRVRAIITLTPQHVRRIYDVFGKVIADYESKFGMIKVFGGEQGEEVKKDKPGGYG